MLPKKSHKSFLLFFRTAILFLIFFSTPSLAFAAGAYLVDDGGVADPKKLQVENWYSQSNTGEQLFVSNPAYQILPNTEFAIQETYDRKSKNGSNNTLWPQIKYRWHQNKAVSSSLTGGVNYSSTNQKTYGSYLYSSTTIKHNDWLDSHLYLGWQNWRHSTYNNKSTDFLNYGLGTEFHFNESLSVIAEAFQTNGTYRTGSKKPAVQLGSRYIASSNFIFDLIYGKNINGNNSNWLTFGATLAF